MRRKGFLYCEVHHGLFIVDHDVGGVKVKTAVNSGPLLAISEVPHKHVVM